MLFFQAHFFVSRRKRQNLVPWKLIAREQCIPACRGCGERDEINCGERVGWREKASEKATASALAD